MPAYAPPDPPPDPLVSTGWLGERSGDQTIAIIDASWRMPGSDAGAAIEAFHQRHIPGAVFFDIDAIAKPHSDLPHMAPDADVFARAMGAAGITQENPVVIYDDAGIFSAPRIWWTFRAMGHREVYVLDGGLPKWIAEARPLTDEISQSPPTSYRALLCKDAFITHHLVRAGLAGNICVLDARPEARFHGHAPEPRAGLHRGHMPGAISVPFTGLLNADRTMKSRTALATYFAGLGVERGTGAITTCGSGISAAVINLALERLGYRQKGLYDGSWAQWGDLRNDPALFPVHHQPTDSQNNE